MTDREKAKQIGSFLRSGRVPDQKEINCYITLAKLVRLTARTIDTPCAEMNTDEFLNVKIKTDLLQLKNN